VVAISEVSLEVGLSGIGIAVSGDAGVEDTGEGIQQVRRQRSISESRENRVMVTVGSDMGATYPSDHISGTPIEVEEGSRDHSNTMLIDFLFRFPILGETWQGCKIYISIHVQEVAEDSNREIGSSKRVPGREVASKETRLPKGEQDMAEGCFSTKTLRQIFLTKGLVQFGQNTMVQRLKGRPEFALGGLGKGFSHSSRGRQWLRTRGTDYRGKRVEFFSTAPSQGWRER
jgi:hypothetical protein